MTDPTPCWRCRALPKVYVEDERLPGIRWEVLSDGQRIKPTVIKGGPYDRPGGYSAMLRDIQALKALKAPKALK